MAKTAKLPKKATALFNFKRLFSTYDANGNLVAHSPNKMDAKKIRPEGGRVSAGPDHWKRQ